MAVVSPGSLNSSMLMYRFKDRTGILLRYSLY